MVNKCQSGQWHSTRLVATVWLHVCPYILLDAHARNIATISFLASVKLSRCNLPVAGALSEDTGLGDYPLKWILSINVNALSPSVSRVDVHNLAYAAIWPAIGGGKHQNPLRTDNDYR